MFACVALTLSVHAHSQGEWAPQLADKLQKALRSKDNGGRNKVSAAEVTKCVAEIQDAVEQQDPERAEKVATELETLGASSEVRELCGALVGAIKKERSIRDEDISHRVDMAIENARNSCRKAKNEFELNQVLLDLHSFQNELQNYPSELKIQGCLTRLQLTSGAVDSWQNMVAFNDAGYTHRADAFAPDLPLSLRAKRTLMAFATSMPF